MTLHSVDVGSDDDNRVVIITQRAPEDAELVRQSRRDHQTSKIYAARQATLEVKPADALGYRKWWSIPMHRELSHAVRRQ